ncbi:hypothetical protein RQP46_001564 [Phenoliferia psychrophenolica]
MAKHGAGLVVLAGRSLTKLQESYKAILLETPLANLRILVLDLEDVASVLVHNAGIMATPYKRHSTTPPCETQFYVNQLTPALFTRLLIPSLHRHTRIVLVSSRGHHYSPVRFDDLDFTGGTEYDPWKSYGQSKSAHMLMAVELAKRGWEAFSLHPGRILETGLLRGFSQEDKIKMGILKESGEVAMDPAELKTIAQGAATTIFAAFEPSISSEVGSYLVDCRVANGDANEYALDPVSIGRAAALRLARRGYSIVIADIQLDKGTATAIEITKLVPGAKAAATLLDVASEESWIEAVAFTVKTFGGLSTLVNNAGIAGPPCGLEDQSLVEWNKLHAINAAEDIAKAIEFLATDDSSFMTGVDLLIDGGLMLK